MESPHPQHLGQGVAGGEEGALPGRAQARGCPRVSVISQHRNPAAPNRASPGSRSNSRSCTTALSVSPSLPGRLTAVKQLRGTDTINTITCQHCLHWNLNCSYLWQMNVFSWIQHGIKIYPFPTRSVQAPRPLTCTIYSAQMGSLF